MAKTFNEIMETLEQIAPLNLQEPWDNSGIQLECHGDKPVECVLVCMELTKAVVQEAVEYKADLIVTHHPLIFGGIKSIRQNQPGGEYLLSLIRHSISVYSSHTPFDSIKGGNNDYLCEKLGLENVTPLVSVDQEGNGMGRIGTLREGRTLETMVRQLALVTGTEDVRFVGRAGTEIRKVGLCTGAGAEFISLAKVQGCDLFITGDLKYHDAQNAKEMGICVIDAGHYGTEKLFTENMAKKLKEKLDSVKIIESQVDLNPFG